MKRILSSALLFLALSASMLAETRQYSTTSKGEQDALNVYALAGANLALNENTYEDENGNFTINGFSISGGGNIGIAKEWKPLWGWRATFGYHGNKGRSTSYIHEIETYSFSNIELFGDITLDLSDAFAPHRSNTAFNTKLFLGVGGMMTFGYPQRELSTTDAYYNSAHFNLAIRMGLLFRYRVSDNVAIAAELSQDIMDDRFSGIKRKYFGVDIRENILLGCIYTF